MILCPIENGALLAGATWTQTKPRITQRFGLNPAMYAPFGLAGHNGIDFGVPVGTPVYAPFDGEVRTKDDGKAGYGLHVKIRNSLRAREMVLGHLSELRVKSGDKVNMGDLIGFSGNTGFSTGAHLHAGLRFLAPSDVPLFEWKVRDYANGFQGYVDFLGAMVTFKGTPTATSILV